MKHLFTYEFLKKATFSISMLFSFSALSQDLVITTEICDSVPNEVRLTGPWWGWNPTGGPVAVNNGNGTWSFTLSPAPTADMEYLLVVNGVQENLVPAVQAGNGACAPITDGATYANRQWLTTDPLTIDNTYGQCTACAPASSIDITVEVCGTTNPTEVRLVGPLWNNWDPTSGPLGVDNGNGTWTMTVSPEPTADMEYLVSVDGVYENLIDDMQNGGSCAPVTDFFAYANRLWTLGSGDVTDIYYDRCVSCLYPDLTITTEICEGTATQVGLAGPLWDNWNAANGPQATDNGDGTWSVTFSPAPADTIEYLVVKDGVMENLVSAMVNGGTCAPVTDFSSYANRRWVIADGDVDNTYGHCINCESLSIDDAAFNTLSIYPVPANEIINLQDESTIGKVEIYSVVGAKHFETNVSATQTQIDISSLESGIYYIKITRENSQFIAPIVKK